jgi:hypothetical protein
VSVVNLDSVYAHEILYLFYYQASSGLDTKYVEGLENVIGLGSYKVHAFLSKNFSQTVSLDKNLIFSGVLLTYESVFNQVYSAYYYVLYFAY